MIIPVKKTLNNIGHIDTKFIDFSESCQKKSSEIGCFLLIVSWRSFPPKFPVKSANFFKNLTLKILRNLTFFRKISEALHWVFGILYWLLFIIYEYLLSHICSTHLAMNSWMLCVCPKPGIMSVQNSSNKARNCDNEVQNKTDNRLAWELWPTFPSIFTAFSSTIKAVPEIPLKEIKQTKQNKNEIVNSYVILIIYWKWNIKLP